MSTKLNIVNTFENSTKKPIAFLVLIGFAGLFVRLVYFPYDVPLGGDSQGYFWYAIDMSILNQLPAGHSVVNNGWPSFLSIIFQLMDSNNFLDYQNMQRFIAVIFSVATIFPVYFLCSRYFKKSYSLLGATLFVFEPRLIQNSFNGTPESIYIFLIALLLFLFLSNNFKKIYLAFVVVALLATTRYEGLLMIIPISVVFFIRFRKQKKDLIKYIVCISIVILILLPIAYLRNETIGQDGLISHISHGPKYYQSEMQGDSSALVDFIYLGGVNLIKYFGWVQIPSFIIFVPLGIILIFKNIDYKKIIIILSVLIMLIPAFYGYSREIQDPKYLYVLYPFFCVLACFTFEIFLKKFRRKNLIFCIIIGGIILSSIIFVEWKSIDYEHYRETYKIFTEIGQKEMKVNTELWTHGGELTYFSWTSLQNVGEFPILHKELPLEKVTWTAVDKRGGIPKWNEQTKQWEVDMEKLKLKVNESDEYYDTEINNLRDYFYVLEKQKVTHLLLDGSNNSPLISDELKFHLKDIFNHENKYPFLIKEYDSRENGFNYYVKVFEIDYDLLGEWIN